MTFWYEAKQFLHQGSGLSMDALHVLAGAIGLVAFSFLLRRSVADWSPWLAVLLLILINEAGDLWIEQWPSPAMQYGESAKDIVLTMVPPTLILLTARRLPRLYASRGRQGGSTP